MTIVHSVGQCPPYWSELISKGKSTAGICQSCFWSEIEKALDEVTPHFLLVESKSPIAALLVLERRERNILRLLTSAARGDARGWLEWHFGPAMLTTNEEEFKQALRDLLSWMDDYTKHKSLGHASGSLAHTFPEELFPSVTRVFAEFGYEVRWWATLLVDLGRSEEEIWQTLAHAARKSVNKAKRNGLEVRKITTAEELDEDFLRPNRKFKTAVGIKTSPILRSKIAWQMDVDHNYRFFIAVDKHGEVQGTLGMYYFNGVATEISSSINPVAIQQGIPAQDLLHWEMMLIARREGCHTFDLAGVSPDLGDEQMAGIRRFKEKWGGRLVKIPRFYKRFRHGLIRFSAMRFNHD